MSPHDDVVLVQWPRGEQLRHRLRAERRPRLLIVDASAPAPLVSDELEDWVRIPAPESDIAARAEQLRRRSSAEPPPSPSVDDDGVLRYGVHEVDLSPIAASLANALIDRIGSVVLRDDLTSATWPDGSGTRNMLDVHIKRLRAQLEPVGLAVVTVRSRGYRLTTDGS